MSQLENEKDIKDLASELIDKLNSLSKQNGKISGNSDIVIQDEPDKWIKIDNKMFYQMIYTDVKKLKRDNETLLNQYLDEIKPTLQSVDENVKELHKSVKSVVSDVDYLMKNKPVTFKSWLKDKSQMAESSFNVIKFTFFILVIFYILSTAMPAIIKFIGKFVGLEAGM